METFKSFDSAIAAARKHFSDEHGFTGWVQPDVKRDSTTFYADDPEIKDGFTVKIDESLLSYPTFESFVFEKDFSDEEREKLAKKGWALPDGSYPIENVEDLKNAIHAYGRSKEKPEAKAHIEKRAREFGKKDLIPTEWD